jgi:primary-amine oxidase
MSLPHPLDGLSLEEAKTVRQLVLDLHTGELLNFREIFLREPRKQELIEFLAAEHAGKVDANTPRPARQAMCFYDAIGSDKVPRYTESVIDLAGGKILATEVVDSKQHGALTL